MTLIIYFVLISFLTYRLSFMLAYDQGPFKTFEKLRNMRKPAPYTKKEKLINLFSDVIRCPYCSGVWISFVFISIYSYALNIYIDSFIEFLFFFTYWLSIAGVQTFLMNRSQS